MDGSGQTGLFGSPTRTRALLTIGLLGETYASELAQILDRPRSRIKDIVDSLEAAGLIAGTALGRTRMLSLNPRYVAANELQALIEKIGLYDVELQRKLGSVRRRPRKGGKEI